MNSLYKVGEKLFEDFQIFDIKSGAHGNVYCVINSVTTQKLAVKMYNPQRGMKAYGIEALQAEFQKWLLMEPHINLMRVKRIDTLKGHPTLVTEYVGGESLRQKMEADSLSAGGFLDILIQTCHGLQALEHQGIIHGDLKPENILVDDFGLVKIIDLSSSFSRDSKKISHGTLPYNMDTGSNNIDFTALGIIIAEALFGLNKLFELIPHFLRQTILNGIERVSTYDAYLSDAKYLKGIGIEELIIKLIIQTEQPSYEEVINNLISAYDNLHQEGVSNEKAQESVNIALTLAHQGQLLSACQHLENVVKVYGNEAHLLAILGSLYLMKNDYTKALNSSEKAIEIDPHNSRAWLNIGGCHNLKQEYSQEQIAYLKGIQYNPRRFDLWYNLSRSYLITNQGELGWRCFGRAIMQNPNHQNVINLLNEIRKMNDDWSKYMLTEFDLYINSSNTKQKRVRSSILSNKDTVSSTIRKTIAELNDKALSLSALGKFEEAVILYDQALNYDPNFFEVLYNKGNALSALGRFAEAREYFEHALTINNSIPSIYSAYADVLRLMGDISRSKKVLEEALSKGQQDSKIFLIMGLVYAEERSFYEGIKWVEKAIGLEPNNHEAWQIRGDLLKELRRYSDALDSFGKALSIKSNDVQSLLKRGELLWGLKQYKLAEKDFRTVLDISPDNFAALCNLGTTIMLNHGDPYEALSCFDQALKITPNDPTILENRQTCLNFIRNYSK